MTDLALFDLPPGPRAAAPQPPMQAEAILSDDGRYRYVLTRRWGPGGTCVFVMLNPSIADAHRSDPTATRCIDFARRWGYDALTIVNLFAIIETDSRRLTDHPDPVGPDNDRHLTDVLATTRLAVAAWGAHPAAGARARQVLTANPRARWAALRVTKDGAPGHPLYVPSVTVPAPYEAPHG